MISSVIFWHYYRKYFLNLLKKTSKTKKYLKSDLECNLKPSIKDKLSTMMRYLVGLSIFFQNVTVYQKSKIWVAQRPSRQQKRVAWSKCYCGKLQSPCPFPSELLPLGPTDWCPVRTQTAVQPELPMFKVKQKSTLYVKFPDFSGWWFKFLLQHHMSQIKHIYRQNYDLWFTVHAFRTFSITKSCHFSNCLPLYLQWTWNNGEYWYEWSKFISKLHKD